MALGIGFAFVLRRDTGEVYCQSIPDEGEEVLWAKDIWGARKTRNAQDEVDQSGMIR